MTRRKKTGRPRGRPYNPNARRHQTTRAGRRGEIDRGSERLPAKKRAATSREDVEMTPAGYRHLDNAQYSALGWVTQLLQRIQLWARREPRRCVDGDRCGGFKSPTGRAGHHRRSRRPGSPGADLPAARRVARAGARARRGGSAATHLHPRRRAPADAARCGSARNVAQGPRRGTVAICVGID